MQSDYPLIKKQRAEVLAISVDNIVDAARMSQHASAAFPVLADTDAAVSKAFGIFDLLGDGLAAPTTIIIDNQRQVLALHVGKHIADRIPSKELLRILSELKWSET